MHREVCSWGCRVGIMEVIVLEKCARCHGEDALALHDGCQCFAVDVSKIEHRFAVLHPEWIPCWSLIHQAHLFLGRALQLQESCGPQARMFPLQANTAAHCPYRSAWLSHLEPWARGFWHWASAKKKKTSMQLQKRSMNSLPRPVQPESNHADTEVK